NPGFLNIRATADGGVAFAETPWNPSPVSPGNVYYWKDNGTSTGVLSTIADSSIGNVHNPGFNCPMLSDSSGRVFFGEDTSTGSYFVWSSATGLSTLIKRVSNPCEGKETIDSTGRVYVGENGSLFWTWASGTGLSTIITVAGWPGDGFGLRISPV